ncbi:SgcJ/EcaC family oxidoreductase [Ponticoccus sp. (in: a-proteobacteria)]|uniref:SgcJ/EcaC family oxidoreductase n=1 Tax=Ponticoccus sp. (in: a-proteobacteria) TaxID=1925025 RepID=UPI003AB8F1C3
MALKRAGDIVAAFVAAWQARSGAEIAALFAEDGDFVNVTGLWWHGRAAIAQPHDYALKSFFAQTTLHVGRTETRTLGPDHALVRCRLTLRGQRAPDGSAAGDRQTILCFVMARGPKGWQAVSAQNTEVQPGKETHVAQGESITPTDYRAP